MDWDCCHLCHWLSEDDVHTGLVGSRFGLFQSPVWTIGLDESKYLLLGQGEAARRPGPGISPCEMWLHLLSSPWDTHNTLFLPPPASRAFTERAMCEIFPCSHRRTKRACSAVKLYLFCSLRPVPPAPIPSSDKMA
ncbi:hypothetical protein FQN60_000284 [Etheostoma spectabile]|uniref:Uncharacterized protein n=1 Tax=Etheostoma spectabile TaxID=54343 RepID=A0A5J5CVD2_9PERO|nr:hypothetical protein FQN60_000284 [Etheostoma spectabile]